MGRIWTAILLASMALPAAAGERPVVMELFTSQSCSSCPPADALLGQLAERSDVVALAWHVSYHDAVGAWRDHFAIPEAWLRQDGYRRRLGLDTVYTPQMIVDGKNDVLGSNASRLLALADGRQTGVGVHVSVNGTQLTIRLEEGADGPADVLLVAYRPVADTPVGGGENVGRRLREYNLVRSFRRLGQWTGTAQTVTASLSDLPEDTGAIALLLQQPDFGSILGAAKLSLSKSQP